MVSMTAGPAMGGPDQGKGLAGLASQDMFMAGEVCPD